MVVHDLGDQGEAEAALTCLVEDASPLVRRALAEDRSLRDRMVIATKGGIRPGIPYNSSAAYLAEALDDSLARMGVETVDLYQIHRRDFLTHPQEVAQALTAMVDAGKVRSIAIMNPKPSALYPNVPTLKSLTGSDWTMGAWRGLAGPKGMPADVQAKLGAALKKIPGLDAKEED